MDLPEHGNDRSRLARIALTALLALLALRALLQGKRVRGALAALGAVAVGYTLVDSSDLTVVDVDRPADESELHCAVCGDPIVPGERRTPNEDGETVHETCLDSA
jgi:predicted nucleic acid-binding Zn ribbon protein